MIYALDRAAIVHWFVGKPTLVAVIVVCAIVARLLLVRFLTRVTRRAVDLHISRNIKSDNLESHNELRRKEQRAASVNTLLNRMLGVVIWAVAGVTILSVFGINVAPILASAGVVGVALGFGAQTLVKDYLAGIFLIIEDQYGIGDVVDVGPVVGTVEDVTLRVTRLRDSSGVVWYIRNGEILRVANRSQGKSQIKSQGTSDE